MGAHDGHRSVVPVEMMGVRGVWRTTLGRIGSAVHLSGMASARIGAMVGVGIGRGRKEVAAERGDRQSAENRREEMDLVHWEQEYDR